MRALWALASSGCWLAKPQNPGCIYDDSGEDVCHDDDESDIHCYCLKTSQHVIAMSSIWLFMLLGYGAGSRLKIIKS